MLLRFYPELNKWRNNSMTFCKWEKKYFFIVSLWNNNLNVQHTNVKDKFSETNLGESLFCQMVFISNIESQSFPWMMVPQELVGGMRSLIKMNVELLFLFSWNAVVIGWTSAVHKLAQTLPRTTWIFCQELFYLRTERSNYSKEKI